MPLCSDLAPLNILNLVTSIGRHSGGLGSTLIELTRAQNALGQKAAIWTLDLPEEVDWVGRTSDLDAQSVVTFPTLGPRQIGYSPLIERMVLAQGRAFNVLHQHSIWMANSRVSNQWRSKLARPTVISPHGALHEYALKYSNWKKQLALWAYEKENLHSASALHALSKRELINIRQFGLTNPVAVIPNGIPQSWLDCAGNAEQFRLENGIPKDKRLMLFLSRLHPIKGLLLLFEAVSKLSQELQDWMLIVAGSGEPSYQAELVKYTNSLKIDKLVQFVGPQFGEAKRNAFAAADLFVLPSYSEGFAIVVLEALGAGIPVLTTYGTPWEDLVLLKCGWWVDTNVFALSEAIRAITRLSPEELRLMGMSGKTLVAKNYTWQIVAERFLQLYHWLLGNVARPDYVIVD